MTDKPKAEKELTEKMKQFCEYYAIHLNATKAALLAGYSKKTAHVIGPENLKKPIIRARIDELLREKTLTREEILARLSAQASFDIGDITDRKGNIDFEIAREAGLTHVIKSIKRKIDKEGTQHIEYELYDAQTALVHLGRAYALFTEKIEQKVDVTVKAYIGISPEDWDNASG